MATFYQVRFAASVRATEAAQGLPGHGRFIADVMDSLPFDQIWTHGTGDRQIDLVYVDELTLSPSGTTTINLTDGSLVDVYGDSVAFAEVVSMTTVNVGATEVYYGPDATNGWLAFVDAVGTRSKLAAAANDQKPPISYRFAPRGVAAPSSGGAGTKNVWSYENQSSAAAGTIWVFWTGRSA